MAVDLMRKFLAWVEWKGAVSGRASQYRQEGRASKDRVGCPYSVNPSILLIQASPGNAMGHGL